MNRLFKICGICVSIIALALLMIASTNENSREQGKVIDKQTSLQYNPVTHTNDYVNYVYVNVKNNIAKIRVNNNDTFNKIKINDEL